MAKPVLANRLQIALRRGSHALDDLASAHPLDERDRLLTLATIHDLHCAPVEDAGAALRWQHHPVVAELKVRLEQVELDRLDRLVGPQARGDAVAAIRAIARRDLIPPVYDWLARDATWHELIDFLAAEGGPDGGFDDLVATCQIGLSGRPKLEMARNYWDEMGRGSLDDVHTELHRDLGRALGLPRIPRDAQPVAALRRAVLGGILATNRRLQPEMAGALGLIELQAGPRCRRVLEAFDRLSAPAGASPFYAEHAEVDPHHGKAWLDEVIAPLAENPRWAAGLIRGAQWRSQVNADFFAHMASRTRRLAPA